MQFLLGALSTVGFFVCLAGSYMLGKRKKPRSHAPVDEKQQQKVKALNDHFIGLMNYDVEKATRKKVI